MNTETVSSPLCDVVQDKVISEPLPRQCDAAVRVMRSMMNLRPTRRHLGGNQHERRHGVIVKHWLMIVSLNALILQCIAGLHEDLSVEMRSIDDVTDKVNMRPQQMNGDVRH